MLQCDAVMWAVHRCKFARCAAVCRSVLQCFAGCGLYTDVNSLGVLQCVAVCCSVLQCVAVCCSDVGSTWM